MPPLILLQRFQSETDDREEDDKETDQEDLDVNDEGKYSVKTYGDFPSSYVFCFTELIHCRTRVLDVLKFFLMFCLLKYIFFRINS